MGKETSYRTILKATSLFGGVQVIQVFLNLVRGKVIAVLLGTAGVGLNSLYISSISMISNISGLGLSFTAVRDIAKAKESGDEQRLAAIIKIFKRWLYLTSFLGFAGVLIFSPLLSLYTFKSYENTVPFIFLAFMLLFGSLSAGNASLLQGTRNLKKYALYTLSGSLVAIVVSVPFYYFFGIKGIVPALIISALITYLFSLYYTAGIETKEVSISWKESFLSGLDMVKLGVAMMLSVFIGSFVHFLVNTYISNNGSIGDLGLYQAGMAITSQSVGLVFTAMAVDYYPRLSAISDNNQLVKQMVNQQGEITMLIATPVLLLLSLMAPIVIKLLYSNEFLAIVDFLRVLAFGMMFKAASYSIGAISFAKGDKRVFFLLEGVFSNASILLFSVLGYKINGLNGLSWAILTMNLLYFIVIVIVTNKLYKFSINKSLGKILIVSTFLMSLLYIVLKSELDDIYYPLAIIIVAISTLYSYLEIDKLIGVKEFVNTILKRKKL
ncbi:O-antigen translocase [Candidatus Kapaibacterium sp.]